jgi:outer membrane lipoprotein-sorting protein
MRRLMLPLVASAMLVAPAVSAADTPQPDVLLKQMKAWLEPARPSTRRLTVTVRSSPGNVVEWKAAQARGQVDGASFALTVLLEPADVRGIALLIRAEPGKPNSEWLYLPYLRRVRRVLPVDEFESFLNTEFTYSDMGFINLQNRKLKLLGEDEVNGTPAYEVQETLGDARTFTRIVTWIDKATKRPIKRQYYDVANRLWKVETFDDVAAVHDTPTAQRVRMEDVQTGYGSEYRVSQLGFDVQIPADLFDWQQLAKAADSPVWK